MNRYLIECTEEQKAGIEKIINIPLKETSNRCWNCKSIGVSLFEEPCKSCTPLMHINWEAQK